MITRRVLLAAALATPAIAQPKTITLVVPFVPGGTTDIMGRLIAQKLAEKLGTTVVVENKGGAGGSIASEAVAKGAPDGSTLLMGHIGTLAVNPNIYEKLGYDSLTSFSHIGLMARVHNVLVVKNDLPVKSVAELISYAKANPKALNYGSGGNGSAAHIATLAFEQAAGIELTHIPYRGTAPAVTDLLGGRLDVFLTGAPAILAQAEAGKVRALAVSGLTRLKTNPELPTLGESLGQPNFEASQWYGLVAPAGMEQGLLMKLNALLNEIMQEKDIIERLAKEGSEPFISTSQAFKTHIETEMNRWKVVVTKANVKL